MDSIKERDGSVVSSSQHMINAWKTDRRMPTLLGIIMSVYPADQKNNYSALQTTDLRGIRHECTVLATDYLGKQPDILIPHVVIPPGRHCGIDNFEEDLPRGCSKMVDGSTYDTSLKKIDYSKLDGEWCLVGFVGGALESPYVAGWWHHPSNRFDLATSGSGYKGKALTQTDLDKNKSRFLRRINGTYLMVNKYGSVYLDTQESNSQVSVKDSKIKREMVAKGGHIQVDVETSAQMEINFNEKGHKGPRLGAGSTSKSPVTDEDLPHPDQPISGSPTARETKRTYRRSKEWETLEKTSQYNVFCENTTSEDDGKKGDFAVLAEDSVSMTVSKDGGKATLISIVDGKINILNSDGTQVNVLSDEVQIVTKSGGMIDLKGSKLAVSAKVDVSGPMAVGGVAGQPGLLGTTYTTAETAFVTAVGTFATDLGATFTLIATFFNGLAGILIPLVPVAVKFTALATTCNTMAAAAPVFSAALKTVLTKNFTSS